MLDYEVHHRRTMDNKMNFFRRNVKATNSNNHEHMFQRYLEMLYVFMQKKMHKNASLKWRLWYLLARRDRKYACFMGFVNNQIRADISQLCPYRLHSFMWKTQKLYETNAFLWKFFPGRPWCLHKKICGNMHTKRDDQTCENIRHFTSHFTFICVNFNVPYWHGRHMTHSILVYYSCNVREPLNVMGVHVCECVSGCVYRLSLFLFSSLFVLCLSSITRFIR